MCTLQFQHHLHEDICVVHTTVCAAHHNVPLLCMLVHLVHCIQLMCPRNAAPPHDTPHNTPASHVMQTPDTLGCTPMHVMQTPTHSCSTDIKQQLLDCQEDHHHLQQQLQASQHDSSSLQSSLEATAAAKQEAAALCLQLHEEVGRLQDQVTGMRHSSSLCQSQQLELQASLSYLSMCMGSKLHITLNSKPY